VKIVENLEKREFVFGFVCSTRTTDCSKRTDTQTLPLTQMNQDDKKRQSAYEAAEKIDRDIAAMDERVKQIVTKLNEAADKNLDASNPVSPSFSSSSM